MAANASIIDTGVDTEAFRFPRLRAKGLNAKASPTAVRQVAVRCVAEMTACVEHLLNTQSSWALETLSNQHEATAGKVLGAIRRFETAELEVARAKAVRHPAFGDFNLIMPPDLLAAVNKPIDVQSMDFRHKRDVVHGLLALQRFNREL